MALPPHLTLTIEKPAAGGRMIARHEGQIVFVRGAIPGERVRVHLEHVKGGVAYAAVDEVESPSPDRRAVEGDPLCGGNVLAHVAYERQLSLKGEIIADAFARIGKLPLPDRVQVRPSQEQGYRMRARLHVREGRIGFFREGTHVLCDAALAGQLLPGTIDLLEEVAAAWRLHGVRAVTEVEVSENVPATERVLLVEAAGSPPDREISAIGHAATRAGITGVIVWRAAPPRHAGHGGSPYVTDVLDLSVLGRTARVTLRRHVAGFFQGNRHLLSALVEAVAAVVPDGPVLDLYAGSGLFGLSCAALGRGPVVAVEGDRYAADDLAHNAGALGDVVRVAAEPVEAYVPRAGTIAGGTILVDPPRTGMSREAMAAIVAAASPRIVYVSCDVATLARDARRLADAGYRMEHVEAFDLFPNTAHVETLAVFAR